MTKSRIALSKINRSSPGYGKIRPVTGTKIGSTMSQEEHSGNSQAAKSGRTKYSTGVRGQTKIFQGTNIIPPTLSALRWRSEKGLLLEAS